MLKILFVCSSNKDRSRTAEDLYRGSKDIEAKSAGVELDADNPVTKEMVNWADAIVVMNDKEDRQKFKLTQRFPYLIPLKKRIIDFDISDNYVRGEPELVALIQKKMKENFDLS